MKWKVETSRNAEKFLAKNTLAQGQVFQLINKSIHHFQGEDINVDIKKLKGEWAGFYRIRKGKIRVVAEFDFEQQTAFIEEIDWRGNIY